MLNRLAAIGPLTANSLRYLREIFPLAILSLFFSYVLLQIPQILEIYRVSAALIIQGPAQGAGTWKVFVGLICSFAALVSLSFLLFTNSIRRLTLAPTLRTLPQSTTWLPPVTAAVLASLPLAALVAGLIASAPLAAEVLVSRALIISALLFSVIFTLVIVAFLFFVNPPTQPAAAKLTRAIMLLVFLLIVAIDAFVFSTTSAIGSLTIILVFFLMAMAALSFISEIGERYNIPAMATIVVIPLALTFVGLNENNKIGRLPQQIEQPSLGDMRNEFTKWLASRPSYPEFRKKNKPYPVLVVAAEGGGMYAAMHSALALSRLYDICPAVAEHIFVISAVSGGSFGSAVYSSLVRAEEAGGRKADQKRCDIAAKADRLRLAKTSLLYPDGIEKKARTILSNDFLSPLVRATLFTDLFQAFLPLRLWNDRASALEASFVHAWPTKDGLSPFSVDFRQLWNPKSNAPALVLNTTNVNSGERVVVSPFLINSPSRLAHFPLTGPELRGTAAEVGISLATAVALSARFPWVTPAGWIDADPLIGGTMTKTAPDENGVPTDSAKLQSGSVPPMLQLVDGGYADNSGVLTALDIMDDLEATISDQKLDDEVSVRLVVLHLDSPMRENRRVPGFMAPLETLLRVREVQGKAAILRARRLLAEDSAQATKEPKPPSSSSSSTRFIELVHRSDAYPLPLGWHMSDVTASIIASSIGHPARCDSGKREPQENGLQHPDCALADIVSAVRLDGAVEPSVAAKQIEVPATTPDPPESAKLFSCLRSNVSFFNSAITPDQASGIRSILNAWNKQTSSKDIRQLAYILGTVYYETGGTMRPLRERGGASNARYVSVDSGQNYYGRGLIQVTWAHNYKKLGDGINQKLLENPELLMDPDISAQATIYGMQLGVFTGKKLSDYFNERSDWVNARRIVNALSQAGLVADYATQIYGCLTAT